ncbi:tRNA (guanine(37)-N1)-methyltransferase 1 [Acorus calamus]|uniref:tRNA (guanine(37)-N1)-methyltransferase n=1 Tax=Acorus calamus TaxID=4465 RepID=A0AAV9FGX4_ACOCL|nr:tRNA (guanine(37)-N1)-methyltransferase 1 [Acorus calamus]
MAAAATATLALGLRSKPLSLSFPSPNKILRRPHLLRLFSSSQTLTLDRDDLDLNYVPSLAKGRESPRERAEPLDLIDRDGFARVFDVAALRVPAEDCAALEGRLRGHLLNWPRVRNVSRVPGDDVDPEMERILSVRNTGGGDSLSRRMYGRADGDGEESLSPVLYREKLVKSFNSRGFLKFRNLAKISRPKKKKERKEREGIERGGKRGFAVVEVVGDGEEMDDDGDLKGLLGDDYKVGYWRGPTRLLLLDERYARRGVEELPEAVKAVLKGGTSESNPSNSTLVQCQLTLYYNYWQMNEILETLLPNGMTIPSSFEVIGHIAHLNLGEEHQPYKKLIGQVVLDKNKPKIQTVVNKIDSIRNDYRTMELEVLAGNHSLVTVVIENNIRFHVDLANVYWNSRLATERQRLISSFSIDDVICDVFSGVGPLAISAAKKVKHVYANDLNPNAVEYLERNIVSNRLDRKIEYLDLMNTEVNKTHDYHLTSIKVFNMDGRRFIDAMFSSPRPHSITQVVMNLPNDAVKFLDAFRGVLKKKHMAKGSRLPKVHVYGFSKSKNPEFDFHERIRTVLCESMVEVEMHRVRLVAPGKWMLCGSFVLPESVAFVKQT